MDVFFSSKNRAAEEFNKPIRDFLIIFNQHRDIHCRRRDLPHERLAWLLEDSWGKIKGKLKGIE